MLCGNYAHAMEKQSGRCPVCGSEQPPARFEAAAHEISEIRKFYEAKRQLGRKAQVGGISIIVFGVLLAQSSMEVGKRGVTNRSAIALIVLGALLALAGSFARWFYLD